MKIENANDNTKTALSSDEAVAVWLLRWQGWIQHRIAAQFGVNSARVNDVLKERKHVGSLAEAEKRWKKLA